MEPDRKALTRKYKTTPRTMGVAVVRHEATGKTFLFAGTDINSLVNRYRTQLRIGGHPNKLLQGDWTAHGEAAFTFEVLDTLVPKEGSESNPAEELAVLELLWLEKLEPYPPKGYNRPPKP